MSRLNRNTTTRDELINEWTPVIKKTLLRCRKRYFISEQYDDQLLDAGVAAFLDAYEDYGRTSGSDLDFREFVFTRIQAAMEMAAAKIGTPVGDHAAVDDLSISDFRLSMTLVDVNEFVTKDGDAIRVVLFGVEHGARVVVEQVDDKSMRDFLELSKSFETEAQARVYFESVVANGADFTFAS